LPSMVYPPRSWITRLGEENVTTLCGRLRVRALPLELGGMRAAAPSLPTAGRLIAATYLLTIFLAR